MISTIYRMFIHTKIYIMEKITLTFFAFILLFSCQKEKAGYEISGILKSIPDNSVVYIYKNKKHIDSAIVFKGRFHLSGKVENPTNVVLRIKNSNDGTSFWLENSNINFEAEKGNFRLARITGSKSQFEDEMLSNRLKENEVKMGILEDSLGSYFDKMTAEERISMGKQIELLERKEIDIYQDFIKEFPDSFVSSNNLQFYAKYWGKAKTQELFDLLSLDNKNSEYGRKISKYIELNKDPQIGDQFVDFEMSNQNGQLKKLSDIKEKVILLEFWASWCAPCIEENPNLVKTYQEFKPKGFEIFAVSLDQNKRNWLKEIEKGGLTWEHLSDLKGKESEASLIYGVDAIPDSFLIDQNGIIVGRNLRGKNLNIKLAELLN